MNRRADNALSRLADRLAEREGTVILLFAVLLLALNLGTTTLYPTSWIDEAMFSDPAINYVNGRGFVSTAWWFSKEQTWCGNVPLYPGALIWWIKMFGSSLHAVRAFNYVVISLLIPVFWLGIKRLRVVRSAAARIGLVVTIFLSYPLCFPYRSARPDCLGMLLCVGVLWAWRARNAKVKAAVLFLAGVLVPFSGLQLVGYFGLLCVLALLWQGTSALRPLATVGVGICAGGAALFTYYYVHHMTGVLATIHEARRLNDAVPLDSGARNFGLQLLSKARHVFMRHAADYGNTPVLAALLVLLSAGRVWRDCALRNLALIGICASVALVATLEFTLHYLAYYHWMNFVILAVTAFVILARVWSELGTGRRVTLVALLAVTAVVGLPVRLCVGAALGQGREFVQLREMVKTNVGPADVVFTDYMAYFPAKAAAAEVYVPFYKALTEADRQSVNVLILSPANYDGHFHVFADTGDWRQVGVISFTPGSAARVVLRLLPNYMSQPTSCGYGVTILRRTPVPGKSAKN